MSWFDAAKFSKYAKTALKQAQKNIDKVLDIQDDDGGNGSSSASVTHIQPSGGSDILTPEVTTVPSEDSNEKETDSFFNSFLDASWSRSTNVDLGVPDHQLDDQKDKLRDEKVAVVTNQNDASSEEDFGKQISSGSIESVVSNDVEPRTPKDSLFDDIDLSETDGEDISYNDASDVSEESTQKQQIDSPIDLCIDNMILNSVPSTEDEPTTSSTNIEYNVEGESVTDLPNAAIKSNLELIMSVDDSAYSEFKSDLIAMDSISDGITSLDDISTRSETQDHRETSGDVSDPSLIINASLIECDLPIAGSCESVEKSCSQSPSSVTRTTSYVDDSIVAHHGVDTITPINNERTLSGHNHVSSTPNSIETDSSQGDHNKCVDWLASFPSKPDGPSDILEFNEIEDSTERTFDELHQSSPGNSSLCVGEPTCNDPLESIMKQAESFLITSSGPSYDVVEDTDFNQDVLVNTLDSAMGDLDQDDTVIKNTLEAEVDISLISSPEHSHEVDQLNKKISNLNNDLKQLQSVIEAREIKIVDLSKENISLQESVSVYKNQITQLELVNQGDDQEMENMREEFTKRIADCDSKCKAAIKERDGYKEKLVETEASLRQSTNEQVSVLTNSLLEKEETIKDLLNEGEILAKKELEKNTHIKKLRVKLKDLTAKNTTLTDQVTSLETEVLKLKDLIEGKESNQKRLEAEVKKLEGITDSQEDEVSNLKDKLEDMEEKYKAMESTLKNTYSEINRLNLENCQKDSEIQDFSHAKEERKQLEDKLKELEKTSKTGKEELLVQLEDLQLVNTRLEHQLSRREDELKKEIEDLHSRLEHAMYRNQELSQSVSAATKPLLRQIENLQSTFSAQSEGWELVEKSLNDRVVSMQDQLSLAVEKERAASEVAVEASSKLKAIKSQEAAFRSEKTNLQIALDKESNRSKEIESEWKRDKSNYETKLSKLKVVVQELEGDKRVLEEQLTAERVRYENDTLRMSTQISLQQQQQQESATSRVNSRQSSRTSSISGDIETSTLKNVSDNPLDRYLSRSSSIHDGLQKGTVTTTAASVEHLKSQLRSREGEVFVLQEQIKESEKRKASLAQELVNLSNQVEELEGCNMELNKLKEEHNDLSSRYNAVLQMYGEKAEEADELKMDIQDVKNMYRQQIQELCGGPR